MEALNFEEKEAEHILFSEYGEKISPGAVYFEADIHGRVGYFTAIEAEKFLGFREVSTEERKKLAKSGKAMSDGSFPIANCSDAANAIHAIGRAKAGDRSAVKAHIRKRVKELGCSGSTFENWK